MPRPVGDTLAMGDERSAGRQEGGYLMTKTI
jgi:hypothetical protein